MKEIPRCGIRGGAPPEERPNFPEDLELRDLKTLVALAIEQPPRREPPDRLHEASAADVAHELRRTGRMPDSGALAGAEAWIRAVRGTGRRLLVRGAAGYPPLLGEIGSPPLVLDVEGDADLAAPSVAVVGSRRSTRYGLSRARSFAVGLARAGFTVVSGLARGIDGAAHRGALEAEGFTIAVLGSAHDRMYPPEHADLARRIAARGAVVTEFPPGTAPLPRHFPRRNRIVAGLALGALVVEAAERSGSLSTARQAADNNREVFAIPGPVQSETSRGCHSLIRAGACLVTSVDEILEELPPLHCSGPKSP